MVSKPEWIKWPESLKPSYKWGEGETAVKFYECPRSVITDRTWRMLSLVNETVNADGEVLHLPFPGAWLEQPQWYRQAVSIVKRERADHRSKELAKQSANRKLNGNR